MSNNVVTGNITLIKQHGKRPNRQSMIKGHIIDLIIQEGFNRPPPKREYMGEGELNQLD